MNKLLLTAVLLCSGCASINAAPTERKCAQVAESIGQGVYLLARHADDASVEPLKVQVRNRIGDFVEYYDCNCRQFLPKP